MDTGMALVIVGNTLAIIACMISLFLWIRAEANADRRHFHDKYDENDMQIRRLENELNRLRHKRKG